MDILQIIGIIIAIVFIIYASIRNLSILVVAPLASLIVILTNQMNLTSTLLGTEASYLTGLTDFVMNFFPVFILGSILAKYMDTSGAAEAIANQILKFTGTDRPYPVLVALLAITALLTYGGVSLFVVIFVLIPLAKPLFKQLNIAWNIVGIPIQLGLGTFTMTMLPGAPSIQNVIPTAYLGTTLTAAPLLGIVGTVVALGFGLWYMKFVLNKSLAKNETFDDYYKGIDIESSHTTGPSFVMSITPIVVLILMNIIGSIFQIENIILISLVTAIVLSAIFFRKELPSQKQVINEGATSSIMPMLLTASAVAFGIIIVLAPGFSFISDFILNISSNPLISLSFASALFGGITGSASGALGILMEAFGQSYVNLGLDPQIIHRVSVMASAVFTVMPHSGAVLSFLALTGLNHKNGFKYIFTALAGANLLALVVVVILATVMN